MRYRRPKSLRGGGEACRGPVFGRACCACGYARTRRVALNLTVPAAAAESAAPAITVRGVGKCYEIYARPIDRLKQTLYRGRRKFYREFWALHDISFEVAPGESIGIIGRNGSGKSTLLQIIAGTLRPDSGEVSVRGRVHALLELGSGFNPEFTGRENVYLNGAVLGLPRREIEARFDQIADFADIGDFLDQPIKTYSTGMVVRLAFAVQALLAPDVLIVDEALSVGDEGFARKCYAWLENFRRAKERSSLSRTIAKPWSNCAIGRCSSITASW